MNILTKYSRNLNYDLKKYICTTLYKAVEQSDEYQMPVLKESDLEEQFISGSGPGGSNVNKRVNCVSLIHKPTGIVVKCHQSRLLQTNRKIAREILLTKLDNLINKENSKQAKEKELKDEKSIKRDQKRKKLARMKAAWLEREQE